jgi:hypothetical protein
MAREKASDHEPDAGREHPPSQLVAGGFRFVR